jgi:hypothetical protein
MVSGVGRTISMTGGTPNFSAYKIKCGTIGAPELIADLPKISPYIY